MAIDKHEMEKYIFDPDNPKQCKSYNLLLRIAQRDNATFISPDFLQYFLGKTLLDGSFKDDLWDVPSNYDELSFSQKIDLYIEQLSEADFEEYKNDLDDDEVPFYNVFKYSFLKNYVGIFWRGDHHFLQTYNKNKYINFVKQHLFYSDMLYNKNKYFVVSDLGKLSGTELKIKVPYTDHYIFFIKRHFTILQNNFEKSSVIITLEENIDKYLEYENPNVKPIFLKKIEDVDRLLNILQQEINEEKFSDKGQEEIPTIDSINIKNFFSMEHIGLNNLKDKKEVYIVGENGDGKTLLLQAIAIGMAGVNEGDVFNLTKTQKKAKIEIVDSAGNVHDKDNNPFDYLFAYGASRYNSCQMKEDQTGYLTLFENRYDLRSPVEWLQYLDHSEKSGKENIVSVTDAKKLLNRLLNRDVEIDVTPDNVLFKEKGSEVNFDQLSAGYKGVITIICDLIARLHEKQPYITHIEDFQGVVLIDEVELHLHPKWKYNFMKKLRDTFPLVQFIVTTHSPTVLLGASKEAVFYKIYKDEGKVSISNQIANEGYTNNTLISSPLFDLETIASRGYDHPVSSDDYIYDKIHKVVAQKIKNDVNVDEAELLQIIDEELDKV